MLKSKVEEVLEKNPPSGPVMLKARWKALLAASVLILISWLPGISSAGEITNIALGNEDGISGLVIETSCPVSFTEHRLHNPERSYLDISGVSIAQDSKIKKEFGLQGLFTRARIAQFNSGTVRIVFDCKRPVKLKARQLSDRQGLFIELPGQDVPVVKDAAQAAAVRKTVAEKTAYESGSELAGKTIHMPGHHRFRIIIDPGHGGKDPGTSGNDGHHEKQYTLAIARKLASILRKDPRYKVFMTRDADYFVTLDNRTLMANRDRADIFVSIHINWSSDHATRGITTYFLNWTNDAEANRVAARENFISAKRMQAARTEVGSILASLQLDAKRDESLRLANYIENSVARSVQLYHPEEPRLGVKEALFYVLVGDKMPAVLVECSFLSNHRDEQLLQKASYINEVAKGIAAGINNYFTKQAIPEDLAQK